MGVGIKMKIKSITFFQVERRRHVSTPPMREIRVLVLVEFGKRIYTRCGPG